MRRSDLFLPASREHRGEWTGATRRLVRAGLVREFGSGLWALTPLGRRVQAKIEARVHAGMRAVGGQEVSLPNLQYGDRWRESGRWEAFEGEMFTLENRDGQAMCLAPSHEEGVVHLLDGLVRSYEELPLTVYQIDSKFRDDHARAGLLRAKEFTMKDAYSVHVDADSLRETYREMRAAYLAIFADLGLDVAVPAADNSVMGGDRSEEFVAPVAEGSCRLTRCVAEGCRWGVTDEAADFAAYAAGDDCPECGGRLATSGGVEVGHVFELGTRYSEAMGLTVDDADGGEVAVEMGSYGIGVSRLLQTLVMQQGWRAGDDAAADTDTDDAGTGVDDADTDAGHAGTDAGDASAGDDLRWPVTDWGCVAPVRAAVVPIGDDAEVRAVAGTIHDALGEDCLLYDADCGLSVGERFAESELLGLPAKVVVGNTYAETGTVEVESRDGDTRRVAPGEVVDAVERFAAGDGG